MSREILSIFAKQYFQKNLSELVYSADGRILLQKGIYLFQELASDLGYRFAWYHMGPYSDQLTSDYYEAVFENGVLGEQSKNGRLKIKGGDRKFKNALVTPKNFTLPKWLELISSINYLRKMERHNKKSEIMRILNDPKRKNMVATWFTVKEIEIGLSFWP